MTVTIYSAMFGAFDVVRTPAIQDVDVDWVMFTDNPQLEAPAPWRVIVEQPRYVQPRLSAKRYKLLPWQCVETRYSIWVDANMEITSPAFAREALAAINGGIGVWQHPQRDCIYDEAIATLRLARQKYLRQPIGAQVKHYRAQGHPVHGGLYACGTLARDHDDRRVHGLGVRWLGECERWSLQDQLSFPVVLRQLGITPGVFPYPQISRHDLANPWLRIHPHLTRL